jgi:multicomponent Na+:H+ antiporter subunit F
VIATGYVMLALAGMGFGYRLLAGPSLTDRVVGLDGLLIVGVSVVVLRAMQTGEGAFLPAAVVVTLVGFVSTAVVARFIEGRGR